MSFLSLHKLAFSIVSAILHLGNVTFENDDQGTGYAQISTQNESASGLKLAAELLKLIIYFWVRICLFKNSIFVAIRRQSNLMQTLAAALRDSLVKAIYGRMFLWIVQEINSSMSIDTNDINNSTHKYQESASVIGILDIFGFEIFEHNSFEQLYKFCK